MKIVVSVYVLLNYISFIDYYSSLSYNFNRCADCFQSFNEHRLQEYSKCRALNH